jgi:orotidine-5'-phosphate decarboxylase
MNRKPHIIVALDVPDSTAIPGIVDNLPEEIIYYKIGLELFSAEGPSSLDALRSRNKRLFLDLKLHDIPRTVARAVTSVARHSVNLLTIHASGGREMLKAAAQAARECGDAGPKLLAVTTLTSLNDQDLAELGVTRPVSEHTLALAELALACGIHGVVCSPLEALAIRRKYGPNPILVTPGIRPAGAEKEDQKRVSTPRAAAEAGADFLVIGRPILEAPDPRLAALNILEELSR